MDEKAHERKLRREDLAHTYVWQDRAGAAYPDHTYAAETAHIILEGEMSITMNGENQTCRAGEHCDVPAGAVHSAQMGARGCWYLIGER